MTDHRDRLLSDIARRACKHLTRVVIRKLQKMRDGMQSGADSPLKNVWDEICVQVQGQESVMWDAYLDTTADIISLHVSALDVTTKRVIWLQTDAGIEWELELDETTSDQVSPYCEEDIVNHVLHEYVLSAASSWTNQRIEKFLLEGYELG